MQNPKIPITANEKGKAAQIFSPSFFTQFSEIFNIHLKVLSGDFELQ